jgi:hypothetical protein
MIYVTCEFETPIGRSDYSDYVRALRLDVSGCDDAGHRILLGRIAADQVLVGDAQTEGIPNAATRSAIFQRATRSCGGSKRAADLSGSTSCEPAFTLINSL